MEQSRVQAEAQRREGGDSVVARKAIIPLVFVILSWVFLVFVWRLCSRLIQQNEPARVLGKREEGLAVLVGFVVLWLMTIWSYVTVVLKGPGLVKDYVMQSEPPLAPGQQQLQQDVAVPMPIPAMRASESSAVPPSTLLPYPSFNADLERFGGNRASSDSMRVLPGSVEPKHNSFSAADFSHSRDMSRPTIVEEPDTSTANVETQLSPSSSPTQPQDQVEAIASEADPQLPGIIGPLASAAAAAGSQVAAAPLTPNNWLPPQRQPNNHPPPLSPSALYCHRCRRIKPPRAHHCRRCGTCVLKMDHHCPWVGGCVGAHNQRFFFIFVFWVTLLELYTLITVSIFFHRRVRSLTRVEGGGWRVDGFLVSLFPICAIFLIFTGALLGTHLFLMSHNMTTIEHVGISKVQARERVLVERWFGMQKDPTQGVLGGLKAKRKMIKSWDQEWGNLTKEGNRWWLGGESELDHNTGTAEKENKTLAKKGKRKGATRTNIEQALGSKVWMWILPIGRYPNEGLQFPINPRFGQEGVQRRREEWPSELR